jgi:hypothetical protein
LKMWRSSGAAVAINRLAQRACQNVKNVTRRNAYDASIPTAKSATNIYAETAPTFVAAACLRGAQVAVTTWCGVLGVVVSRLAASTRECRTAMSAAQPWTSTTRSYHKNVTTLLV